MKPSLSLFLLAALCLRPLQAVDAGKPPVDPRQVMGAGYRELWNPELQSRIDRDIERNRKADAVLQCEGMPAGAAVQVEQLDHAFQFGANIFNFDQLGADELNRKYKAVFGTLLNAATIGFYWKTFEPEPGHPRYLAADKDAAAYWNNRPNPWKEFHWRRPAPERIIEFCEVNHIRMHAHPLIWGNEDWNHPSWVSKAPDKVAEMERLFAKRIKEIAGHYRGRLPSWDIVNESVDMAPGQPRYGVMPEDYTYKVYKLAEQEFPASVRFDINDSWRPVYPPFIRDLIARGARIDVVGLQMHIFDSQSCLDISEGKTVFPNNTSWKPLDVISYLEELSALGRPIHLSEITIPAPGDDARAQEIQAVIARDMYRLWFSWPSIFRITWWNLVDDCGASGEPTKSGIFTRDMQPKPAFFALDNLINHEWKTRLTVKAGEHGQVKFRGFKGRYRVKWMDASGHEQQVELDLHKDGDGLAAGSSDTKR